MLGFLYFKHNDFQKFILTKVKITIINKKLKEKTLIKQTLSVFDKTF